MATFTCPACAKTSAHPVDVDQGYCGACRWWTGDPVLAAHRPTRRLDGFLGTGAFAFPVIVDETMPDGELRIEGAPGSAATIHLDP